MVRQLFTQLSRESFIYGLSAAATKLIGFILVPLYTHLLSPADFGILDLLTSVTGFLSAVLILGLDTATAIRFYAHESSEDRRAVVSTFLYFELGLTVAVCGVLFVFAQPLAGLLFDNAAYADYIRLGLATVPFATFLTILLDISRLVRLPWRYLTLAVGNLVLTALLVVVALVVLHLGIGGVMAATLVGTLGFSLFGWAWTRPHYALSFSAPLLRQMLWIGLPLVPAAVAYWVINFANRWFLLHITSPDQVGIYGLATRLAAPVVLIVTAFQIAWVPFSLSIAKQETAGPIYARTLLYFLALTFGTLLLLTLYADPLIAIFATPAYLPAAGILALVGAGNIAYGAYYIVATGVNLTGKTLHIGWTTVVAAVVSILLNFALIPVFGISGAACAGLVANSIPVVLLFIIAQRLHYIPYDILRAGILIVVASVALTVATLMPPQGLLLDLLLRTGLLAGFVVTLAALGIIRSQELQAIRQMLRGAVRLGSQP